MLYISRLQQLSSQLHKSKSSQKASEQCKILIQILASLENTNTNSNIKIDINNDKYKQKHIGDDNACSINFNQKGIIVELLTKVCLIQFEKFKKVVGLFVTGLYTGTDRSVTTVRKRNNQQVGNTTTVKRKRKQNAQIARTGIDLDKMLQLQLSSPHNTSVPSQNQAQKIQNEDILQLQLIQNLRILPQINSQKYHPTTPIKQPSEQQQEQNKNWDQYKQIIKPIQSKNIKRTKNQNQTDIRTRKKNRQLTQVLSQMINMDISLPSMSSQLSIKKELENVLEVTKKKKLSQRQNCLLYGMEIFREGEVDWVDFGDIGKVREFYGRNYRNSKQKPRNNNFYNQDTPFLHIPSSLSPHSQYSQPESQNKPINTLFHKLSQQYDENESEKKTIKFDEFVSKNNISKENKSIFFYDLLCHCQTYQLQQRDVHKFGDIYVQVINRPRN